MHVNDVNDDDNNDSVDKTDDTWPLLKGCTASLKRTYEYLEIIFGMQYFKSKTFYIRP